MNGALEGQPIVTFTEPSAKFTQGTGTPPGDIPSVTGHVGRPRRSRPCRPPAIPPASAARWARRCPAASSPAPRPTAARPAARFVTIYTSRGGGGRQQRPQPRRRPAARRQPAVTTPATADPGGWRHRRWQAAASRRQAGQADQAARRADPADDEGPTRSASGLRRRRLCSVVRRQPARTRRTMAATRPPSARPGHGGVGSLHREAHLRHTAGSGGRDGLADDRLELVVAELLRQVGLEDGELRLLLVGELRATGAGVGLGGLAALLGLLGEDLEHVVVGQLAVLLAGDLLVGDGGEGHPQRAGPDLVALAHRGGEVGLQLLLEGAHAPSLSGRATRPRCAGSSWRARGVRGWGPCVP